MPPLGTSVPDTQAIALVSRWITNDLAAYRTFGQWQVEHFDSTNAAAALAASDPDGDDADNWTEYLTGRSPVNGADVWEIGIERDAQGVLIHYPQLPNRVVTLEWLADFGATNRWRFLEVRGNRPVIPLGSGPRVVPDGVPGGAAARHYRARVVEP